MGCWRGQARCAAVLVFGALVGGCCAMPKLRCTSPARAEEIDAELHEYNVARMEPSMRAAATRRGAELLPDRVQSRGLTPICGGKYDHGDHACVVERRSSGALHRLVEPNGTQRIAIQVEDGTPVMARLARRGTTLYVLIAKVTWHQKRRRVRCECDAGLVMDWADGFETIDYAFIVDDLPSLRVQFVEVPVSADRINWQCRAYAV